MDPDNRVTTFFPIHRTIFHNVANYKIKPCTRSTVNSLARSIMADDGKPNVCLNEIYCPEDN